MDPKSFPFLEATAEIIPDPDWVLGSLFYVTKSDRGQGSGYRTFFPIPRA